MSLVLTVLATVAFWKLVGRPLIAWLDTTSFRGIHIVPERRAEREREEVGR